ncbi:hypothetical protein [Amycolatopsis sp. NPDC059657]|uniref:hypothetical protein n=1 Tax=Amycolatopsis sp. NPDC059657 TaxID=3346899 RepID=UPI00366B13F4
MRHAELKTDVVDLSELSLKELRTSADPVLLASVALLAGRTERSRPVVLQNQATKEN